MDMLVGATWQSATDSGAIEVRDPQDDSLIDTVPRGTLADLHVALEEASRGAERARSMPTHARTDVLRRTAEIIAGRSDAHAEMIAREGIKTIKEARREVWRCTETLRLSAEEARKPTGEALHFDQRPGSERRMGYWFREPIGVVAAITPFNDPLNLVAHKVGPAIAAGNAVVVKPHSSTPLSALLLAQAFLEAGVPEGVLQVITGSGADIGEPLAGDPRVSMVTFTGGPNAGAKVAKAASGKRVVLELGSNSPVVVLQDADIEAAAEAIVDGGYGCCGQNCLHVQRVMAHSSISADLKAAMLAVIARIRLGDKRSETTDMGPLINEAAASRVQAMVDDALERGGTLLAGGTRRGTSMQPTLIGDLPADCRLARDEVFGPVVGVIDVDSLDEAIAVANEVAFGLHAAIFTRDINSAMRGVRELRAGAVMINDTGDYRTDAMPFGGVKGSGLGREGVPSAFQEMTTVKVVCFNL
jgi:glyceraldehyde-3-phosphate dehydrogenase (NADP+)